MSEPEVRGMIDDDQLVVVNDKWGYRYAGPGFLEVGDLVVCPSAHRRGGWWIGKVTDIGSTYRGRFSTILRKASGDDVYEYARLLRESER